MITRFTCFIIVCFSLNMSYAQKKTIDASIYNQWKRIGDQQISSNGNFSVYTIKPLRGDGYLYVINNQTGKKDSIFRGIDPQLSINETFVAFKITPGFDTLHTCELKKINKDKWPKDTLGIWFLKNDSLVKIPKIKEYKLAPEADVIAYLSTTNDWPTGYLSKKEKKKEAKKEKKKGAPKSDGKLLTIWTPTEAKTSSYRYVSQFEIAKNGAYVAFTEQEKFKKDSLRLVVHSIEKKNTWKHDRRFVEFSQLNAESPTFIGLFATDTTEQKRWSLFTYDVANQLFTVVIDTTKRFEQTRMLSNNYKPRLINNDKRLLFGVWDAPFNPAKDTLLENEKVKLDLWHWKDERMQPQQLVELKKDQTQTNLYSMSLSNKQIVQIGSDTLQLQFLNKAQYPYVLAISDEATKGQTWKSPLPSDYYRISIETGERKLLRKNTYFGLDLSPSGNYFTYFDRTTKQQYVQEVGSGKTGCMTCGTKAEWLDDINGMPVEAGPIGVIGWSANDNGVLLQSHHDQWYYDISSKKLTSISSSIRNSAADTNYRYRLYNLNQDSSYLYPENVLINRVDLSNKSETIYRVNSDFASPKLELITGSEHHYLGFQKAKKSRILLFNRQSVADYPDAYILGGKQTTPLRISTTNPQQSQYNWATVELIKWKSYDGIPLEGLIYKPTDFDPQKTYPLLVYFYELYSDQFHNHYAPKPTASVIHPTEYASAGYIILIPDIRYKQGHPAKGAYDCIMSGTDAVLKKYSNIDPKRLGLQGQSWGGYQTAQLITMTDRYAAAMAGAPVGNMISAYGGIRWGSGFSRQFQYEHTQSRIGKTIWEAPELYIENSPVFHLPKVKTPLLMMHNDQDGAVPWYQGIELYTGLRRLGKPVWMLNYNGDDHNLLKNPNRMDLSIRMRQFFDYYLLGAKKPQWLEEGLPALKKGKETRYGFVGE